MTQLNRTVINEQMLLQVCYFLLFISDKLPAENYSAHVFVFMFQSQPGGEKINK